MNLTKLVPLFFGARSKANVCRKARELGLTSTTRHKKVGQLGLDLKLTEAQRRAVIGANTKRYIAEKGHPRGALGLKHNPETLAVLSIKSRAAWADPESKLNSEAERQRRSDALVGQPNQGKMFRGGFGPYSRAVAGRREDLGGLYVRSRWEANYARYLNLAVKAGSIDSWEYEAKTFFFESIKRGTRSYTPDFLLRFSDGRHEWHEVKGWMDDKSRVRLNRMRKFFPDEKVVVVGSKWFKANAKRLAGLIREWE